MGTSFQKENITCVKMPRHESCWHNPKEACVAPASEDLASGVRRGGRPSIGPNHPEFAPNGRLSPLSSKELEYILFLSILKIGQDAWCITGIQQVPMGYTVPRDAGE